MLAKILYERDDFLKPLLLDNQCKAALPNYTVGANGLLQPIFKET